MVVAELPSPSSQIPDSSCSLDLIAHRPSGKAPRTTTTPSFVFRRGVGTQAGRTSEYRILTKSGEVRWLHDYGRPVWDEAQGRVMCVIGAGRDITDRQRVEELLRQREMKEQTIAVNLRKFRKGLTLYVALRQAQGERGEGRNRSQNPFVLSLERSRRVEARTPLGSMAKNHAESLSELQGDAERGVKGSVLTVHTLRVEEGCVPD